MSQAMYNTGLVQTARNPVLCTSKFTVNLATGVVTILNGKRNTISAGVGTGIVTIILPQIFTACEFADVIVLDPTLTGTYSILSQMETTVNNKTQLQFTLAKGGTPAAVTTGSFTCYFSAIGVTN